MRRLHWLTIVDGILYVLQVRKPCPEHHISFVHREFVIELLAGY